MNHLFREYLVSQSVWRKLSVPDFTMFPEAEFIEWLTKVISTLSLDKCRIFCGTLWAIWGDRNSCIHNKKSRSSQETVVFVHGYLKELDGIKTAKQELISLGRKWRPPPVNFDGANDERRKVSASGVVIRDRTGCVLLTSTDLHSDVESAFAAEVVTCPRATQIALEMNRGDVIIEGDSLSIIKKCNSTDRDKSMVGAYIQDIHRLKEKINRIRFEYIPRSANNVAHLLARNL
ncbi:reverse transcriptase [Gossypium australe]|uniref:Reverse transcriptase n=1 Tax=Gossypium australe TaxID=47621 RepID=A0A5B6W7P3_9ROSI|nr:reverse transcriptase [Gossypium australe]